MHLNEYTNFEEVNCGNLSLFRTERIGQLLNVWRRSAAKKVNSSALLIRRVAAAAVGSPLKEKQINSFFLATVGTGVPVGIGSMFL